MSCRSFSSQPYGCADVQDNPCEQFVSLRDRLAAMTAAKNKALDALKKTQSLADLSQGDDKERDWDTELTALITELEKGNAHDRLR